MFDLLRVRDFGLLWLAGLISVAGDIALIIVLPLHIYRLTDSTLATAGVLLAAVMPRVLIGSVAGVFVDQWDRKWTMVISNVCQATFLLPVLVAPDHVALLYSIAMIQGTIGLFFRPAEGALLPRLVGEEHLVAANALNSLNNNFGMLIGPAAGATLYAATGLSGTVLADIATFIVSALLIATIRTDARPERDDDAAVTGAAWARLAANWRAGLAVVRRNPPLRVLFASSVVNGVSDGVFTTLGLSPLVLDVLGGTPAQVGWLATTQAIGGLLAGVLIIRIGHRLSLRWLLGGGLAGIGLADLGSANARLFASAGNPAVGVAMGFMVAAGPPAVASTTARQSIVQEQASDAYRGRVFGALSSVLGISLIIGFAIGGVLGDALGLVGVLSAAALLRVVGGLAVVVFMPRPETSPSSAKPESAIAE